MKRLLASLAVLALVGFGCVTKTPDVPAGTTLYENTQYGFSFAYPTNMEVRNREEDVRQSEYLGMDADFFISLRDTVRDVKATNIAWYYAVPGLTVDQFKTALEASNASGAVKVTSSEPVTVNDLAMTKIVSTTEMGVDKVHYLFDHDGTTIVISVFLMEDAAWDPVLQTMSRL